MHRAKTGFILITSLWLHRPPPTLSFTRFCDTRTSSLKFLKSPMFSYPRFRQIKQQYDLKVHEAELVQARLKQSTHHHQLEEIETMQKTVGKSSDI